MPWPQQLACGRPDHEDVPQSGIPERTVAHDLPSTVGKEPYRLMNLDVFEYELDHQMGVYGSVPFVQAHGPKGSQGLLWLNPSETFVDVGCAQGGGGGACSHWASAAGTVEAFLFAGATPAQVTRQHAALTGTTPLPPLFALGYHQCRWNYKDEEDVSAVHAKFDEHNLPFDVLWLDIEHTDRKRYFTWNEDFFPTPLRMQQELARTGRKMVTIIDPHLRAEDDYAVYAAAKEQSLLVRKADNSSHFEGDCWPGRSAWVDYLQPAARAFWASRFLPDAYAGSSATLYTWNDMNEPSVFDGPEITMPPTLLHHDEHGRFYEHRELHNMCARVPAPRPRLISMIAWDARLARAPRRLPHLHHHRPPLAQVRPADAHGDLRGPAAGVPRPPAVRAHPRLLLGLAAVRGGVDGRQQGLVGAPRRLDAHAPLALGRGHPLRRRRRRRLLRQP